MKFAHVVVDFSEIPKLLTPINYCAILQILITEY